MRDAPADETRAFWRGWGSGAAQRDGGDAPGALAGNIKARTLNCNSGNFCKPRAQWPDGNLDQPLRFCAPEILCPAQGVAPVNGGPGGGRIWARSVHPEPTPWRLFGFFLPGQKETRPAGRNSPAYNKRSPKPAPSSDPFGATYPYPLWPSAISP